MEINYTLLHQITFYMMFVALALAVFVAVERVLFYIYTLRHARTLEDLVTGHKGPLETLPDEMIGHDSVPAEAVRRMLAERRRAHSAQDVQSLSGAIYLALKARLQRNLWLLDTVVTAAPLLGLLGTILGIIETFTTLATSGVSDPKGVSAGIGTALLATALGIAIALFGLVFLNHFHDRVERISEHLKVLLLRASTGVDAAS